MARGLLIGLLVAGFMVSGCNLSRDNQALNLSTDHLSSDALPASAVTSEDAVFSATDPWETGYDPYGFADIRPGTRPNINTDEAGLWLVTDRMTEQLRTAGNRFHDEELNTYLGNLVCELAGPYCADTRTFVVRNPYFNVTMMPNGTMQVWTGLLLRCHNEAQIAAVLGHEIGHYIRRHSLQRQRDVIAKTDALTFIGMVFGAVGMPSASDIAGLVTIGSIQAFSRDHEREADLIGSSLMAQRGLAPEEASVLWSNLVRETDAQEEKQRGSYFLSTHPSDEERIQILTDMAERYNETGREFDSGHDQYLSVISKHRASFLEDELQLGNSQKMMELLKILYEEGHNRAEIKYFEGEVYRRRAEEGDFEKALALYANAEEEEGVPPRDLYRASGLVKRRLGDKSGAVQDLKKFLALNPAASDGALLEAIINRLEKG